MLGGQTLADSGDRLENARRSTRRSVRRINGATRILGLHPVEDQQAMCGRFTQKMTWREIHTLYRMPKHTTLLNLQPRYNGCPTQKFAACRLDERSNHTIAKLRWGLVPAWAKDAKIGSHLINARSETVHEKRAFRSAFRRRRCLIPADGWLEWRKEGNLKQPYFITSSSGNPLSFAGLWERWNKGTETIEGFTILTTGARATLNDIHHRQPAIIETANFDEWLEPGTDTERLLEMARTRSAGPFNRWPVSTRVNSARNDDPDLLVPIET